MKHMSKNFLPFIDKAPLLGKYFSIKVPTKSLFLGDMAEKITGVEDTPNLLNKRNGYGKRPIWYLLRPLNVLVPYNYEVSKNANYGFETSTIDIIEVDYSQVADITEVHDKLALYPFLNGYETAVISDDRVINEASNGISLFIAEIDKKNKTLKYDRPITTNEGADSLFLNMLKSVEVMNEASIEDLKKLGKKTNNFKINTQTPVETRIESYLLGNYVTQRCPLLIGVSAVGKSQLVKNLCKKHGFRLVDIRTSFMSRLDLEGLTEVVYNADGSVESEATGMQEFISCTDEYINFCKQAIPIVDEALAKETDKAKQANLEITLKKYQEGAKPPVLFLDELTRTEASVRQALTNILSSKTFMGHKMTIARIIGADNQPVDMSEEMQDVFNNNDVNDPAFADRFEAIPIRPKDVLDNWIAWANSQDDEGLSSIHKLILEYLESHPDMYYNYSYVEKAYLDSYDENIISTKPYPNYRSWDLLSGYMYECDKLKREYMQLTILGFIGKEAGEPFIEFLQSKGIVVKVSEPEDELDNVVEDAIMSGAPTLLVTSSGCGKSWRVNNVAKKLGAIVLEVNLSTMDRTDVMGMPCKVDTKTYIGGQLGDDELAGQMTDLSNKFKLPSKMTVKAPRSSIVKTFKDAIATGRRVVLLFEEVTRVTNPATMSAVFEAVSDNRIFGVDFDPKQVSILCNANIGEDYEDCQSLDPAYVARFNVYHKVGYTLDDAKSARKFFNENYSAHMNSYFDTKTDGEILQMIKAVEQRAIDESVPSTRAWYDLNLFLNDANTSSTVKGTILFADKKSQRSIQRVGQATSVQDVSMTKAVDAIDAKIDNWSGVGANMSIQVNGENYTGDELVDLFNTCKDFIRKGDENYLEPMKNIIQMLVYLDSKIIQNRQEAISFIIGESASQDFCNFYNTVSGTEQTRIEIPDLKDKKLFEPFLDNTLKASGASAVIVNTLTTLMGSIFDYHQFNIPAGHYQHFVLKSLEKLPTPDAIALFTTTIVGDSKLDAMLKYADDGKLDFVKAVAKFMNLDVDDKTWGRIDGTAKDDDIVVTSKRAFI